MLMIHNKMRRIFKNDCLAVTNAATGGNGSNPYRLKAKIRRAKQ
jgi:hypothetical protein